LTTQLAIASRHFHFFKGLWDSREKFDKELHWCRDFWYQTAGAHMNTTLVQLCRVYDYQERGINLITFLRKVKVIVEKPPEEFDVGEIDRQQLSADISICGHQHSNFEPVHGPLIQLIDKLREWRKKIVAHYNDEIAVFDERQFRFQNRWELHDLKQLIDQAVVILDRYAFSSGKDIGYTECFDGKADCDLAQKVVRHFTAAIS
jgi:AbiU2